MADYEPGAADGRLMDHEYDGIQEFDNPIPGWWHLIFFLTIVFSIVYVAVYHVSIYGPSIYEQYDASVAEYYRQQFAKFGDLEPNAETIGGLAANANYMDAIEGTFIARCASCHAKDGGGLVGPNLTDDAYLHVTNIEDIYGTINEGVPLKGMPAWGQQLHQTEIILLSAYVASLRGAEASSPKPPEGEPAPAFPEFEPLTFDTESSGETGADEASG